MARPKRGNKPKKTPRQKVAAFFKWFGIVAVSMAVLCAGAFGIFYVATPIPDPNKDFQTNVTQLYFRDGVTQLGSFAIQNRVSIPLSEIPQHAQDAILAAENETFWTDPGISVSGLMRAFITAVGPGQTVGGSTITQQYVKVLYLTQEKSLTRKLKEIMIALKIGQEVPKEQILEGYLNTVYFGRGAYGIQAASKSFFGVDAKSLTQQQSIALVAMVNDPGRLDPNNGAKQRADLLERYQYTINNLVRTGKMSEADKATMYASLPDFPKLTKDSRFGGPNGYLLMMVADEMKASGFTEAQINGGGYQVTTTLDAAMQKAAVDTVTASAQKAAAERKKDVANLHPALASVDVASGGVLAMYGGSDYIASNRNWATTARSTGSTFKPWALVAGLRSGFTLTDTVNGNSFVPKGSRTPVTNAGNGNYGSVTLLQAVTRSINSAFVDLVQQIPDGSNQVMKAAQDAGIPKDDSWKADPRQIALGAGQVTPLHAAAAYATLGNGGKLVSPHVITEIKDASGATVFKSPVVVSQAIEPDVAQDATYALTHVAEEGTGRTAGQLNWPVAGKTGTYYVSELRETRASWFVGFTKQISTSVMFVAGDDGEGNLDEYSSGFYGSGYPASTWLAYMKIAMVGLPKVDFPGQSNRASTQRPTTAEAPVSVPPDQIQPPESSSSPTASATSPAPTPTGPATTAPPTPAPTRTRPPTGPPTAAPVSPAATRTP